MQSAISRRWKYFSHCRHSAGAFLLTGHCELVPFASSLRTATLGEMKLDKIYVDPARQRLGLGGRLIGHVAQRALAQGCNTLIPEVNKQNERAIGAYRKHGFVVR